jgi:hypothetical protein
MTRYLGRLAEPEPCTEEAREQGCICRMSAVHSASLEPSHVIIYEWCPIHGRDPDDEMERRRDDAREAARDFEEDRAEDYRDD